MKSMLPAFALSVILTVSICMVPSAFGQQAPIAVMTDKESYRDHNAIVVTGNVTDLLSTQLSLWIQAPKTGNIVYIDQISVAPDKTFSTTICTAGGPLWGGVGTYTITVQYGYDTHRASTTFEYERYDTTPSEIPEYYIIDSFEITGAKVQSIVPMEDTNSLLVSLATYTFIQQDQGHAIMGTYSKEFPSKTDDGSLTINIPRSIADATLDDGSDGQYLVLVDGEKREFEEVITEDSRILTIEFEAGTEEIEIIGTWVIPEFGTIAAMVLAMSIVAVIVVSSRSRLSAVT